MAGLLSKPKTPSIPQVQIPDPPKARRMPVYSDMSNIEAGRRQRTLAKKRKGFQSTILSDTISDATGLGG